MSDIIPKSPKNTTQDLDIDFDSLLNLEESFYQESYDEAFKIGEEHSFRDGKLLGIQTGFQRFILIGALKKASNLLMEINNAKLSKENKDDNPKIEKYLSSLSNILSLINEFYKDSLINVTNTPEDVDIYEKNIKTIRSKSKILFSQLGEKSFYPEIENNCKEIAGEIPTTQINSQEDNMW